MINRELLPPLAILRRGVEGCIVTHCVFPLAMKIVCHHVNEVEVPEGVKEISEMQEKG